MSIKSAVSVVALVAGLVAGPAFAQNSMTIGESAVPEGEMTEVQAKCDELALSSSTSLSDSTTDGSAGQETDDEDPTSTSDQPPAEGLDNATTSIDLDLITLQECVDGGFVTGNVDAQTDATSN